MTFVFCTFSITENGIQHLDKIFHDREDANYYVSTNNKIGSLIEGEIIVRQIIKKYKLN